MAQDAVAGSLPCPSDLKRSATDFWVQEELHGHRFVQEQEPYMIVLETLSVCRSKPLGSVSPERETHETINYAIPWQRKLRFLVFEDRHLEQVAADDTIQEHVKWRTWKDLANEQFDHVESGADNFAYLDRALVKDFEALLQAVRILRSLEIDVMHSRRWTSRFLAVTGPDLVFHDLKSSDHHWSTDRRFFGRGGELVYLMLNRSGHAESLGERIGVRLLDPEDPMNRIARKLSDPEEEGRATSVHIGYLPLAEHQAYERLAEDWRALLDLDRLPNSHLFEPLFRITGLNLVRYLAERACEVGGQGHPEPILADFTDGNDRQLRDQSKAHFNRHRDAAHHAVRAFVEAKAEADEAWRKAVETGSADAAAKVLKRLFGVKPDKTGRLPTPRAQLEALIEAAQVRDKNNAHKYVRSLAINTGLATARQRVGAWFAVDDAMIAAMVLANVGTSLELGDFVERLFERYGLVIGPREARRAFRRLPVDVSCFEGNLAALEDRMTRLGLTRRLSDDCAFVQNPYRQADE